jgi:hypothetical protein
MEAFARATHIAWYHQQRLAGDKKRQPASCRQQRNRHNHKVLNAISCLVKMSSIHVSVVHNGLISPNIILPFERR